MDQQETKLKTMNKLIIDNRTDLQDIHAVSLVSKVVEQGRISNDEKQYCYGTAFSIDGKQFLVWTDLNKKSDRFVICEDKNSSDD